MSLVHSPEDKIARPILHAITSAIMSLETVTGSLKEHEIGKGDAECFCQAKRLL